MNIATHKWLDASSLAPYDVFDSGWADLIRDLFAEIDRLIAGSGARVRLLQVKEKFGALRIYYRLDNGAPLQAAQVAAAVCAAESVSYRTCFTCGQPGSLRWLSGWVVPMCDEHAVLDAR